MAYTAGCEFVSHGNLPVQSLEQSDSELTWRGLEFTTSAHLMLGSNGELSIQFADLDEALYLNIEGLDRADLYFRPVYITVGQPFRVSLLDENDKSLLSLNYRQTEAQGYAIEYDPGSLSTDSVKVQCKLNGETQHFDTHALNREAMPFVAATTNSEPTSIHYYKGEDGSILIEFDYEMQTTRTVGSVRLAFATGSDAFCSHIGFQPIPLRNEELSLVTSGLRLIGLKEIHLRKLHLQ